MSCYILFLLILILLLFKKNRKKNIIVLFSIFTIFFFFLFYIYFTPPGRIVKTPLTTDIQKETVKEYLQGKTNFNIPDEYEVIDIAIQKGKDQMITVCGYLDGDIANLIALLDSDYKKSLCSEYDIESLHKLFGNKSTQTNEVPYEFSKKEGGYPVITVEPTNISDRHIIYFFIVDNTFSL